MRDRIARYARQLEGLSIADLSRGAEKLVSRERRYTAALIAHLAEISRRWGKKGVRSLFFRPAGVNKRGQEKKRDLTPFFSRDYCVICLRLGKGSVWNRTQVAKVSRRFPQALQYLVEGNSSGRGEPTENSSGRGGRGEEARGACGISTGSAGISAASFSVHSELSARASSEACGLSV